MDESVVLGGRYELCSQIGQGGMAEVYRAHDRVLDREVAVKLLRQASVESHDRARFADEARMLGRLSHPGLVTVLDAATSEEEPYLVMELVKGPSLADCCRGVTLEPTRVAAIGAQLADALNYAHDNGIVHRDVKPANVLLGEDDRALLTDFGIAKLLSDSTGYTATGTAVGTAAYLAPEQVRGENVTLATDVYSLGLVLLEALTGERAYGGSPTEAALARLTTPPALPPTLPAGWHDLLRAMMALDPADRPSTVQIGDALRQLAAGVEPSVAVPTGKSDVRATYASAPPVTGSAYGAATADSMKLHATDRRGPASLLGGLARRVGMSWKWAAAAVLAVSLVVGVLLVVDVFTTRPQPDVPAGVPEQLQQPLQDLHDAVEGGR
ncbi:serine/threonine-protein kinase [Actinopolymorpha pittospori]